MSKLCPHCKIHEHYGYYTKESKTYYDKDVLMDYFQSSEDTAFDLNLLKDCSNLLVVGAVPFSTSASSFKRWFHHTKTANAEIKGPQVKKTKRSVGYDCIFDIKNKGCFTIMKKRWHKLSSLMNDNSHVIECNNKCPSRFQFLAYPQKKQYLNSVVEGDAIVHKPTVTLLRRILYFSHRELFLQYDQLQGNLRGPSKVS